MTDLNQLKATAQADVATAKSKAVAFVKAHVPTIVAAAAGFATGKFGLLGFVLKHIGL